MLDVPAPYFPADTRRVALADWIEAYVVARGGTVSYGDVSVIVTQEAVQNGESRLAASWVELRARSQSLGPLWPLRFQDPDCEMLRVRDARQTRRNLFHYFLCVLSVESDLDDGDELFELCVANLLTGLDLTFSLRLGYPANADWPYGFPNVDRQAPASFGRAIRLYAKATGEQFRRYPPRAKKDAKIDVVAWKEMEGPRHGYLHFIGQCTTAKNWRSSGKLNELNLKKIDDYVSWAVPPVRFFAVPFVASTLPSGMWREACQDGGLILDRHRLLGLYERVRLESRTRELIEEFCNDVY